MGHSDLSSAVAGVFSCVGSFPTGEGYVVTVSVRWVLAQKALALELRAGAGGLDREVSFVHTTELSEPFRWLSGGELLLTTGLRLPVTTPERAAYLEGLHDAGVAAVGFGTGLSFAEVPSDLVEAADRLGLPVLEVPLPTPFAAVVTLVMNRLAEQQYDAVVRASRAQPRMTRAVVAGGAAAIVRELATATSSAVVLLDDTGRVLEQHPRGGGSGVLDEIRTLAAERGTVSSRVSVTPAGISISVQRIAIGSATHGHVAVVGPVLGNVDHILVGHAASLLALDFEKPARVQSAQDKLNSVALSLVLSDLDGLAPVWAQIDLAAGADGTVRAVTVDADTPSRAQRVEAAMATHSAAAGRQLFARRWSSRVTLVVRGTDDSTFAASTIAGLEISERRRLRVGISASHPVPQLAQAVEESRLAASSAAAGADPVEFGSLVGGVLLAHASTRQALATVGDATIAPLEKYDTANGTDLVASLRAFLEANGHWESAASALGVHRHTLRSRVSRIEATVPCSLDDARVRAELLLALIARGT